MPEVYLMPIGSKKPLEHMYDTLINYVPKSLIESYLDKEKAEFNSFIKSDEIPVWGLEPGSSNLRTWNNFKSGDIVIFVPSKEDLLVTQILHKVRNYELAKRLWGVDNDKITTWELVFFLKIISILHLDKRTLLVKMGYSETDNLMGNRRVTDKFISSFNTVENFIEMYLTTEITLESFSQETTDSIIDKSLSKNELLNTLKEKLSSFEGPTTEYININGRRIKRRRLLVKYIKELADYKCQACGFTLIKKNGKRYIEAAHIDPLATSKLDTIVNMAALCPNCHKKLDHGNEAAREEVLKALGKI